MMAGEEAVVTKICRTIIITVLLSSALDGEGVKREAGFFWKGDDDCKDNGTVSGNGGVVIRMSVVLDKEIVVIVRIGCQLTMIHTTARGCRTVNNFLN